jgi:hypothetical protein
MGKAINEKAELSPNSAAAFRQNAQTVIPISLNPPMKHELPCFALLIDADNDTKKLLRPSSKKSPAMLAGSLCAASMATSRRLIWLAKWRETLANHGIHPIQQYRNSVGKNASDSALIIDAMDLLHSGRLRGILPGQQRRRLHSAGNANSRRWLSVFGFGRKHAPKLCQRLRTLYIC